MDRLFEVFEAHNIRYFFMPAATTRRTPTTRCISRHKNAATSCAASACPRRSTTTCRTPTTHGYGSVVKYNATTVMEIACDASSMATDDGACFIIEVMGRAAGWIAAGTVLAKEGKEDNAPHIILLPEIHLNEEAFLAKVKETTDRRLLHRGCGRGVKDAEGHEIGRTKPG